MGTQNNPLSVEQARDIQTVHVFDLLVRLDADLYLLESHLKEHCVTCHVCRPLIQGTNSALPRMPVHTYYLNDSFGALHRAVLLHGTVEPGGPAWEFISGDTHDLMVLAADLEARGVRGILP